MLDIRTAFFITGLIYLIMPAVVWLALRAQKSRSVLMWSSGGALIGVGAMLISGRGQLPDWVGYEVALLSIFVGSSQRIQSLLTELGRPLPLLTPVAMGSAMGLVFGLTRQMIPESTLHFAWAMVWIGLLFLWQSWLAWVLSKAQENDNAKWLALTYLPLAALFLLRAVQSLLGLAPSGALVNGHIPILIAILALLAAVLGNTSFLGIFVEAASRQQIAHARERARREENARLGVQITRLDRQRSLGMIASALSHELSQPLNNINLITEVAEMDARRAPELAPLMRQHFKSIERNVQATMAIMDRIRKFIRAEEIRLVPITMQDVHSDVMQLMNEWLYTEKVEPVSTVYETPLPILGDSVQLSQILVNLLRNAVQATEGQLRRRIEITVAPDDTPGRAIFRIWDNGPGFDADYLQAAADEAFESKKPNGLGLGLSISREIAEQHKGTLTVANDPDRGVS